MIDYRKDKKWTVYVHIVPKELSSYVYDKYYVGITSLKPEHRWGCEGNGYSKRGIFGRAISRYGWNNICHQIIANNLTENEAKDMERSLIKLLSSNDSVHGYNLTTGGDGTAGRVMSHETRIKISKSNSGKKRTAEQIERIKNNTPTFKYEKNKNSKPIYQFTKDGVFIKKHCSATKIQDEYGYDARQIGKNARHTLKSAYGYIWVYEQDVSFKNKSTELKDMTLFTIPRKTFYLFTYYGDFINKYDSIKAAEKDSGETESTIRSSAKNKYYGKKFIWRYKEDVEYIDCKYKIKDFVEKRKTGNEKSIYQFTLNGTFLEQFESCVYASKITKINASSISKVAHNKTGTAGGYIWRYNDDVIEKDGVFFITSN